MILSDFLQKCKKLIEKNPDALNMEMFTVNGASGAVDELSNPFVSKLVPETEDDEDFDFTEDEALVIKELLPKNYPYDRVIWVYNGN